MEMQLPYKNNLISYFHLENVPIKMFVMFFFESTDS